MTEPGIDGTPQPAGLRRRARYSFFGARLNQWLGRRADAQRMCRRALSYCDYTKAYRLLSELELPAEHYFKLLARVHRHVRPATYLEVGVSRGESLKLVAPETLALGIDPQPRVACSLAANQRIFTQTSDEFFARSDVPGLLGDRPLEMAFIDGMHHFEYALRDFINIEPLCRRQSLIFIHDCFPIDARSAERHQTTAFWSGDIWRLMVLLKKYRPDLAIRTLGTPPTGLGLITQLDPASTVLRSRLPQLIAEGLALDFSAIAQRRAEALNLVPGDWPHVRQLLDSR
ncbi:MAG TPA: class I SAM-dependent methyltransferase [Steroidobacteraceae bacterium]|nr:class I SAM-dependent methyltransferase [Steroidobacteraceae bacterium]